MSVFHKQVFILIFILVGPLCSIAQSNRVELSQSLKQTVIEYKEHLKSKGMNSDGLCNTFRIDYIDIGSEELVMVGPIIFLSSINPIPNIYSIVDSSLVVIYSGIEKHIENIDVINTYDLFAKHTIDDRITIDEDGNYIVPLINITWDTGLFVITQNKIRSKEFKLNAEFYYHLREK